ncbi:MAG: Unknown protein [uncultured Sulfurovum sp.]|uniref:Fibronectin type-III domain-containing protein n=1 Tax=uncultured Sulfurovum sp. TaxID=269237 RepID=A0A6S6TUL7_9BACT|nr:MAG: Unknown protein [uncultured Sulfurovum sp.]
MKKTLLLMLILTLTINARITEWILNNPSLILDDDHILINDAYNYPIIKDDGKIRYMISHAVGEKDFRSFDGWEPGIWTGLNNADEKWGLTRNDGVVPYGTTTVQTKNTSVGMHLNTFGNPPVRNEEGKLITDIEAAQIVASWSGKNLWNTKKNDDLCIQSELDIHSFDVQSGATSQVMYTLIFNSKDTYVVGPDGNTRALNFFFNILIYDNHQNIKERLIRDAETYMPIVMTAAKSKYNLNDTYSTGIDGLSTQKFIRGTPPSGFKNFGACITRTQMEQAITNLKDQFEDYNLPNFTISNLRLHRVIPALELATNNAKKNGRIGVVFKNLKVYRSSDETTPTPPPTSTTPKAPTALSVYATDTSSLKIKFNDNSTNETSFYLVYQNLTTKKWYSKHISAKSGTSQYTYHLTGLAPNTKYKIYVKSFNNNAQKGSAYVTTYGQTKDNTPPPTSTTPKAPTALSVYATDTSSLKIKFNDNSTNETSFYLVYQNLTTKKWYSKHISAKSGTSQYTYHLTGLAPNTKYKIYVKSFNNNAQKGSAYATTYGQTR